MKLIYQIQQSVRNYLLRKSYYKLYKVIYHNNPLTSVPLKSGRVIN